MAGFKRIIRSNQLKENELVKNITKEYIEFYNGSRIILIGISKDTIFNVKGLDNVKYLWLDEAHNINSEIMQILIPSIRAKNSQIIITMNPLNTDDYIYTNYIKKGNSDYFISIKVNYIDNPFLPEVLERDRINDYNTLPRPIYLHIWEGEPNDYNDMLVIDTNRMKYYDDNLQYKYTQIVLSLDTAYSVKTSADYSVIAVIGKYENEYHLLSITRGQWDFFTLKERTKSVYLTISNKYKAPLALLIENKASGQSLIQELQRETNIPIITTTPIVDKFNRVVNDFLPYIDKLKLPLSNNTYNNWINDYVKECNNFRSDGKHEHDDMVDATSQALKYLNKHAIDFDKIKQIFINSKKDVF